MIILFVMNFPLFGQYTLSGFITNKSGDGISGVEVHDKTESLTVVTNKEGHFSLVLSEKGLHEFVAFGYEYQPVKKKVRINGDATLRVILTRLAIDLSEMTIMEQREQVFNIKRLDMVEGTSIFAGKKSEVILMDQMIVNKATNNARQIYSQVVGLNIYESGDAGLQLSIGGRGLDPNRTANFNTRQNGYDISADVLGYPESYYTPPAEALSEIQIVRGAASLQYGTQFGGLINFKMKRPIQEKIQFITRQSIGSFGAFSSFKSLSGTMKKLSYYTYYHYKRGEGFRPNAEFHSNNVFTHLNYKFSENTNLSLDLTRMKYLAKQAGGLTDSQFNQDPNFSNRSRNWFEVNWNLASMKMSHKFSPKTELSMVVFGLYAKRKALGYRGNPTRLNGNPVVEEDPIDDGSYIFNRDLIKGVFRNYGVETKFLTRYKLAGKNAVLLLGAKYYHANNLSVQGAGSKGINADFSFDQSAVDYPNQSDFTFPNQNLALFGEHIFFVGEKLAITPGFRMEMIKTESDGIYNSVAFDIADNPISNQFLTDRRSFDRFFTLFGLGISYDVSENAELYGNFSENYRSVTFSDIRTVSPTFLIDPAITDESGFTSDVGFRGKINNLIVYEVGAFGLLYNDRIGIILDDRANRIRKNIGQAFIYGLEIFGDINLLHAFGAKSSTYHLNLFVNAAWTDSRYLRSDEQNVAGKQIEFIPTFNFKTGVNIEFGDFSANVQWTSVSAQFTDVQNSQIPEASDNRSGVIGEIPEYQVLDLSMAYGWKNYQIEGSFNNVLNTDYFTRRATGYPGPGIIPSDPRNFHFTFQLKI